MHFLKALTLTFSIFGYTWLTSSSYVGDPPQLFAECFYPEDPGSARVQQDSTEFRTNLNCFLKSAGAESCRLAQLTLSGASHQGAAF